VTGPIRIVFLVAVAENGVIGRCGQVPWRLPSDLKAFRKRTIGKPLIMGRKTYQSIGGPLDQRDNIVLSRGRDAYPAGVRVVATLKEAIDLGCRLAAQKGNDEVMVIGGAQVYAAALPSAQRIYLTLVHATPQGDTYLAPFDPNEWGETLREPMPQTMGDEFSADFIVLERKR
jgi:dihydrofolate reductase